MMYILYAVLNTPESFDAGPDLLGMDDQALEIFRLNGLAVVYSALTISLSNPDVCSLKRYFQVIEQLYKMHPCIPLRFGCTVESFREMATHLKGQVECYKRLLNKLKGRVEVSIRLLDKSLQSAQGYKGDIEPGPKAENGRAYLLARRAHYEAKEKRGDGLNPLSESIKEHFKGLYKECKAELAGRDKAIPLPTLHFLVEANKLDPFKAVFDQICETYREEAALLLSGPWPPFNFVLTEDQII